MLAVFPVCPEAVGAFHEEFVRENAPCCHAVENDGNERENCIDLINESCSLRAGVEIHEELDGEPDLETESHESREYGSPVLEHSDFVCRQC